MERKVHITVNRILRISNEAARVVFHHSWIFPDFTEFGESRQNPEVSMVARDTPYLTRRELPYLWKWGCFTTILRIFPRKEILFSLGKDHPRWDSNKHHKQTLGGGWERGGAECEWSDWEPGRVARGRGQMEGRGGVIQEQGPDGGKEWGQMGQGPDGSWDQMGCQVVRPDMVGPDRSRPDGGVRGGGGASIWYPIPYVVPHPPFGYPSSLSSIPSPVWYSIPCLVSHPLSGTQPLSGTPFKTLGTPTFTSYQSGILHSWIFPLLSPGW